MRQWTIRFCSLICGLFLFALGSVIIINANVGYSPWEVFHVGLSLLTGMTIGTAVIVTGLFITVVDVICQERIGVGTLANMVLVGLFIDLIMFSQLILQTNDTIIGILMLIIGLLVNSFGCYLYIKSGFGAGPRDSLMVVIKRKTKLPIGVSRGLLELSAIIIGSLLGGMVGIGTLISIVAGSYFIQMVFKIMKFDAAKIEHESFLDTYNKLTKTKQN